MICGTFIVLYLSVHFKNMQPKLNFLTYCNPHAPTSLTGLLYTKPISQLVAMHCKGGTATLMWLSCSRCGEFQYDLCAEFSCYKMCRKFRQNFPDLPLFFFCRKTIYRYVQRPGAAGSALEEVDDTYQGNTGRQCAWMETCPAGSWRDFTVNVFVCTISTRWTKPLRLCSCKPSVVLKLHHVDGEANLNYVHFRGVCTAEIHSTVVPFRGEARFHHSGYVKD
jgi:hypothetical protein